jgi:adenylate cyclase
VISTSKIISELQRRGLFRVGAAYLVSAWAITKMVDLGVEKFAAPDWVMQGLLATLYAGFPLVLAWTWFYGLDLPTLNFDDGDGEFEMPDLGIGKNASAAAEPAPENSIAVLPFANMSGSEDNEYFSDGLSEELLNLLAHIPEMQVSARTSSFSFKGKNIDVRDIGRQLNVAHLLEGSVRQAGEQVRITAQLIKASDGFHLWSETYDRELTNIFAVQDEISIAVVEALKIEILGNVPTALETHPEAYRLYLLGKYQFEKYDADSLEESLKSFSAALEIDPNFSPALLSITGAYIYQINLQVIPRDEGLDLARAALKRAMEINPDSGDAQSAFAWIAAYYDHDWPQAKVYIERALELGPGNAFVLRRAGGMLQALGQAARAVDVSQKAVILDPLSAQGFHNLACVLFLNSRYDEALNAGYQALKIQEKLTHTRYIMVISALLQGNNSLAIELAIAETDPASNIAAQCLTAYATKDEQADSILERLVEQHAEDAPCIIAEVYAFRGDAENALRWLEQGATMHDPTITQIPCHPLFVNLHADSRWDDILDRIGLGSALEAPYT